MTKDKALILSLTIAAGAAYILLRKFKDEAPDSDEQQGGTTMEQQPGYSNARGYRNNNPLNIRYNANNAWRGKVTPNTDGAFEQFVSMPYGFRAALYLFRKYIRQGYNTVEKIVGKWAPPSENHTGKYIQFVCGKTQMAPDTVLRTFDEQDLKTLAHAMAWYENGSAPHYADINEGWELL